MRQKLSRVSAACAALAVTAGCVPPLPGSFTKQSNVWDGFSYEVKAFSVLHHDQHNLGQPNDDHGKTGISLGKKDYFEFEGVPLEFERNQIAVELTSVDHLPEILAALGPGTKVIEQMSLHGVPTITGEKSDRTACSIPSSEITPTPRYLLNVAPSANPDLSDLQSLAVRTGKRGHFTFSSRSSAHLYKKMMMLNLNYPEKVVRASLNGTLTPSTSTREGRYVEQLSNESYSIVPNHALFYWPGEPGFFGRNKGINYIPKDSNQPHFYHVGAGAKTIVAVIDRGFQGANEPFVPEAVIRRMEMVYNTTTNNENIAGAKDEDGRYHGRKVASLIFAKPNDGVGTLGLAFQAQPLLIHTRSAWDLEEALLHSRHWGADVINISLQTRTLPDLPGARAVLESIAPYYGALSLVLNEGRIVVAAAGNDGDGINFPAAFNGVISVSSYDQRGNRYPEHNSKYVDVWAPGVEVAVASDPTLSGDIDGLEVEAYDIETGTSFAAPMVAGFAAVAKGLGWSKDTDSLLHLLNRYGYTKKDGFEVEPALNCLGTYQGYVNGEFGIPRPKPTPTPTPTPTPLIPPPTGGIPAPL